ncbi:MAG: hypothetical protein BGO21_24630 [Dyadobacter sp. 50-39]|uniref:universal stress protein n=1 Tax=Dyadobacter sp. 50-39 TaxID=1895756 RepID=UPI0009669977|nr:universal stress protein [Dyadobacter sp. 50-39]OJV21765.1 MAG: hypothetical protein BGO21_24630 [Dyadobacter sp. 50-39]
MRKILVPTDFSENAEKALSFAIRIADKTKAQLLMLFVYHPYINDVALPEYIGSLEIYKELEASYREKLDEAVALARHRGINAEGIWATGGTQPAILHTARQNEVDLIVMGRTGQGGFLDKLLGSNSASIATEADCAVLVIPPMAADADFNNIVYATQLEFDKKPTLEQAIGLARQLKARITFLKINSDEQLDIQSDAQYIMEMKESFGIASEDITIRNAQSVLRGLQAHCHQTRADMLILCRRDKDLLQTILNGPGLTSKLALATDTPLLVYHLKDA